MAAVLFVDDEPMILKSIERSLRAEEYSCYYANSGEQALEILESHVIDVLVTDMRMPGMRGLDLLKTAKAYYPNMVRIVLSGYTQINQMIVTINQGDIFRFIPKPWDVDTELKPAIKDALDYAEFMASKQTDQERLEMRNLLYQNVLNRFENKKVRLNQNIETMKDSQEFTMKKVEELLDDYKGLVKEEHRKEILYAIKWQRKIHSLMPLRSVKMDYDLAIAMIREIIDSSEPLFRPSFSKHMTRKPRVYGTVDLLPPIIQWILDLVREDNVIAALHVEVSGNIDEQIENPNQPPLYMSVLLDMSCELDVFPEAFHKRFSHLSELMRPYAEIRYAHKAHRFVVQIKMDLERSV